MGFSNGNGNGSGDNHSDRQIVDFCVGDTCLVCDTVRCMVMVEMVVIGDVDIGEDCFMNNQRSRKYLNVRLVCMVV